MTLSIECHNADCRDYLNVMSTLIMLNVIMLNVIMLSVITLSVIMLRVKVPKSIFLMGLLEKEMFGYIS